MLRPFPFRIASAGALAAMVVVGAACGNISLSSSSAGTAAPAGGGPQEFDAAADGGTISTLAPPDAGAAPAVTGNPLCNYGFANSAAHTCVPDYDDPLSQQCISGAPDVPAPTADAGGALSGGGNDDGGGAGSASDAGTADDAGPTSDAGTTTNDAGGTTGTATPACHVIAPDGGTWKSQICTVAGPGKEGDQCQASTDCAGTFECVGSPGRCRHYCCTGDSVCDATYTPSFCDVQQTVTGKIDVPVCVPVSGCSLFGKCPDGTTCAVVKDDGTTSCVQIGNVAVGGACDEFHCATGLTCLGISGSRTCFQLCHVDSPAECPSGTTCTGSAQLFMDPQFGICQ